jgi:hypothetical protein
MAKSLENKRRSYLANKDDIKNNIQDKFKEDIWCDKELEDTIK